MTTILRSIDEARTALAAWRAHHPGDRLALVPTMGALHDGHLSLVGLAREQAQAVVVSIFVNPLQFGPDEDFDRYPRTFEADVAALEAEGVEFVFAPAVDDMYPPVPGATASSGATETRITAGAAASVLDGAHRPGHFDGVLTVVAKLLHIVGPDSAVFGEKDAQQLFVVRQMVRDLNLPAEIMGAPIVREADGLARSSRNVYLSSGDRDAGLAISRALRSARDAADAGADVAGALAAARAVVAAEPGLAPDYVEAVDPATFLPPAADHRGATLLLIAARAGATRLIDNAVVVVGGSVREPGADEATADGARE